MSICDFQKMVDGCLSGDKEYQRAARVKNRNKQPLKNTFAQRSCLPAKSHKQKVPSISRQIKAGEYDFNGKFDIAMDKVLEELLK
jgi:hypothetical protein